MPRLKIRKFRGLNLNQSVPDEPWFQRDLKNTRVVNGEMHVRDGWQRLRNSNQSTGAFVTRLFDFRNAAATLYHVQKVAGDNQLSTFSTTDPTAAFTALISSLSATEPCDLANGNGYLFVADNEVKNYISNGINSAGSLELHSVTASTALSPTETGAVTGFGTGVFQVCYSFYNPTLDMETPPRAAESITKVSANVGIRVTTPADPGSGYTTMRFYRVRANESKFYYDGSSTTFASTYSFTNLDTTLGSASFPASELHNDVGAIVAEKPVAFIHCEWHKGRMFGATSGVRIRYSDLNRPTQWRVATIAQSPAYYHDVNEGAGRKIMGMNSFDGSLVVFKDYSIVVKNGDIDCSTFQWFVAVDGEGCVARWSRAVAPSVGVFFAGQHGIYLFNNNRIENISDLPDGTGIGDFYRGLANKSSAKGIWNEQTREYWIALDETAAGYPTGVYAYNADEKTWSGPFKNGEYITALGVCEVSVGPRVLVGLYNGTDGGNTVKTGVDAGSDSNSAGTNYTGTVSSVTGNHLNDSGASFFTTGSGLTALYVAVRMSASSYETKRITGNTATQLQVGSAWTGAPTGKSYFVGGIDAIMSFCRFDAGDAGVKELQRISGVWKKQTHTQPIRCGWTIDDATAPSYAGHERTMGDVKFSIPATDRAVSFSAYFNILAHNSGVEIRGLEVDFDVYDDRSPSA